MVIQCGIGIGLALGLPHRRAARSCPDWPRTVIIDDIEFIQFITSIYLEMRYRKAILFREMSQHTKEY